MDVRPTLLVAPTRSSSSRNSVHKLPHLLMSPCGTLYQFVALRPSCLVTDAMGRAATAMICTLSATAQAADCVRVAVAGESLTHDLAVLFSTNGLKNIIYGQGRVG